MEFLSLNTCYSYIKRSFNTFTQHLLQLWLVLTALYTFFNLAVEELLLISLDMPDLVRFAEQGSIYGFTTQQTYALMGVGILFGILISLIVTNFFIWKAYEVLEKVIAPLKLSRITLVEFCTRAVIADILAGIAIGVGMLLFFVPGVLAIILYSVYVEHIAFEGLSAMEALRKSRELVSKTGKMKVFSLLIAYAVAFFAFGFGAGILELFIPVMPLQYVIDAAFSSFVVLFSATFTTLMYVDMKQGTL